MIQSIDEVGLLKPNIPRTSIDIFLNRQDFDPPRRMILTSGCGGGISLQDLTETHPPLDTPMSITPEIIFERMHDLQGEATSLQCSTRRAYFCFSQPTRYFSKC